VQPARKRRFAPKQPPFATVTYQKKRDVRRHCRSGGTRRWRTWPSGAGPRACARAGPYQSCPSRPQSPAPGSRA